MHSIDEPATESQLDQLRQFGFEPDRPLTQGEAAYLLNDFRHRPEAQAAVNNPAPQALPEAYQLRLAVENARHLAERVGPIEAERFNADLQRAITRRQNFWFDTCCDPSQMHAHTAEILQLYRKFGCQFVNPTREQVDEILTALDAAMPTWDRDEPEYFYQTLELNFPELRRRL